MPYALRLKNGKPLRKRCSLRNRVCIPLNWPPQSAPKWPRRPGFWPICVGASGDEGEVEGLSLFITSFQ